MAFQINTTTIINDDADDNPNLGSGALASVTTGLRNTAVGICALASDAGGIKNTAVGFHSLKSNAGGCFDYFPPYGVFLPQGSYNTAIGAYSLCSNTTGNFNIAIGISSLCSNTTGRGNIAIGLDSLGCNIRGDSNIAIGPDSLGYSTTKTAQIAIGQSAGKNGAGGIAIGGSALQNNLDPTGQNGNVAIGCRALHAGTSLIRTVAIGERALSCNLRSSNVAVGACAAENNTSGCQNIAIGYQALRCNTTGISNTAVGHRSGCIITTGSNNTALGFCAQPSSATVSNEFTLGNSAVSNLRCNDTTISSLSDARDKDNIQDLDWGVEFIESLRPVKFDWNRRDGSMKGKKDMGFIAQELDLIEDQYQSHEYTRLVHKENPDKWEADPMKTYPILIKAVQQLSAKVKVIESEVAVLKA